jgi:pyrimidine-nucleoside phosphorylase
MSFSEAIAVKRDGGRLDAEHIGTFVDGATHGSVPVEQLAAMLMAICCRGMDADETRELTRAMRCSGEEWRLAEVSPEAVDKHSTGGVGDTVSLVYAPMLAAVGVPVAMMAGRGLAHSQGTIDKLEACPGVDIDRDRSEVLDLLDRCGAAIVAQTDAIAPADRTLYALRDVTATVPSLPLIVSSIMSKKLALGAGTLVLDVKWGRGAFRKTRAEAVELATALRDVARASGVACEALITDMNEPLGPALGTACEVRAALAVLDGGGDVRLREVTIALGVEAMVLRGHDRASARRQLEAVLDDGRARTAWDRMITAHGGDPDPENLATPRLRVDVPATAAGRVVVVDGEALGWVAVDLGAGRRRRDEAVDHGAGVEVHARLGAEVERGQPLATLLVGDRPVDVDGLVGRTRRAFEIGPEPVDTGRLVVGTVDDVGP